MADGSLLAKLTEYTAARGTPVIVAASVIFLAAMALLRYLLLTLFNPRR
jgi:hypothetical protein